MLWTQAMSLCMTSRSKLHELQQRAFALPPEVSHIISSKVPLPNLKKHELQQQIFAWILEPYFLMLIPVELHGGTATNYFLTPEQLHVCIWHNKKVIATNYNNCSFAYKYISGSNVFHDFYECALGMEWPIYIYKPINITSYLYIILYIVSMRIMNDVCSETRHW